MLKFLLSLLIISLDVMMRDGRKGARLLVYDLFD